MFKVGDFIRHREFGVGFVDNFDSEGLCYCRFPGWGERVCTPYPGNMNLVTIQDSGIETQEFKVYTPSPEVTLRDQFAMAALTGFISNPHWDVQEIDILPELCFCCADEMLKAREIK